MRLMKALAAVAVVLFVVTFIVIGGHYYIQYRLTKALESDTYVDRIVQRVVERNRAGAASSVPQFSDPFPRQSPPQPAVRPSSPYGDWERSWEQQRQ